MSKMKVVQCWDDGLVSDIRLTEILQRHGAKASFNLCMGSYKPNRSVLWNYQGQNVVAPSLSELTSLFGSFDIANHSLTHPDLTALSSQAAMAEIADNKKRLEDLFQKPVEGFCYPFGAANPQVAELVQTSSHLYGRTVKTCNQGIDSSDPYQLQPSCHFLDGDFWQKYAASKKQGVFYFWGHSYELRDEKMWRSFEKAISYINDDTETEWCSITELFH